MIHRPLIVVALLALLSTSCSGASDAQVATLSGDGSVSSPSDEVPSDPSIEDAVLAFAACMREHGVETFEDPEVGADGSVGFGFRGAGGDEDPFGGVDRDTVRQARNACSELLEGVAIGPGGGQFDTEEFQDRFVEFAACMRGNGVQMDDPDFSGGFGPGQGGEPREGGGPFGDIDLDDPAVQQAFETCQAVFGDDFPLPRGGAGPGGRPPTGGVDGDA